MAEQLMRIPQVRKVCNLNSRPTKSYTALRIVRYRLYENSCVAMTQTWTSLLVTKLRCNRTNKIKGLILVRG